ncbi:hypothetical protein CEE69_21245 [Rhodopirellula bahusiensis]|uniref:Uncharacterized protein n=1 Tax=Rhodopirellula bahusiensis TaxID=2014065 RepID=A0A2G1W318_9BACT|nr:hypothetical protein CEE69_21245 [Rhodopirellula bahusiensis]
MTHGKTPFEAGEKVEAGNRRSDWTRIIPHPPTSDAPSDQMHQSKIDPMKRHDSTQKADEVNSPRRLQ